MATASPASSRPPRRAFLVALALPGQSSWEVDDHLDELAELARSAGVAVVGRAVQARRAPHPKTFIGSGKAEEIGRAAGQLDADLLVFDDDLSSSQVQALEGLLDAQVLDRSGLILELFSQRARSREARTQVELARLQYLLPRLTRRWSHLSRQAGGIGVRGGEGETQLEADRRMLRRRIGQLERDLEKIERTRKVQRRNRRDVRQIALAGYTNAGKSTLFNRLTQGGVRAEDRLFATLDSKLRRGGLGEGEVAVFADTVGFIRKLPHDLVASFRSTLEEIVFADLVLHVVDRSHPRWEDQLAVGREVLADLGVEEERVLTVYNKMDRVDPLELHRDGDGVRVSAETGEGIDESLRPAMRERLSVPA
ncbi:MAG: GTPase HflX [Thermoanaerobaculia bacterium]